MTNNSATPPINWVDEIVKMVLIKQALAEVDPDELWPHHFPKVRATKTKITKCEAWLGHKLDSEHVSFLLHADGWDGFMQTTDLFGTNDFCGSARFLEGQTMLNAYDDAIFSDLGVSRQDLFPIAVSLLDKDIFVMEKPSVNSSVRIFWLAGEEIDRFPSFHEFFLSMQDYNRSLIDDMLDDDEQPAEPLTPSPVSTH